MDRKKRAGRRQTGAHTDRSRTPAWCGPDVTTHARSARCRRCVGGAPEKCRRRPVTVGNVLASPSDARLACGTFASPSPHRHRRRPLTRLAPADSPADSPAATPTGSPTSHTRSGLGHPESAGGAPSAPDRRLSRLLSGPTGATGNVTSRGGRLLRAARGITPGDPMIVRSVEKVRGLISEGARLRARAPQMCVRTRASRRREGRAISGPPPPARHPDGQGDGHPARPYTVGVEGREGAGQRRAPPPVDSPDSSPGQALDPPSPLARKAVPPSRTVVHRKGPLPRAGESQAKRPDLHAVPPLRGGSPVAVLPAPGPEIARSRPR